MATNGAQLDNQGHWEKILQNNPGHSQWYIQRWEAMEARGEDTAGEARFVDALVGRGAKIFDAGAGTGRVGGELAARGHSVTGIDIDPTLVAYARQRYPAAQWHVGNLADTLKVLGASARESFDAAVAAGNVVSFVAPNLRARVMQNICDVLKPGGCYVSGFGTGRGYSLDDFMTDALRAGFCQSQQFSTWQLGPYEDEAGFAVVILRK